MKSGPRPNATPESRGPAPRTTAARDWESSATRNAGEVRLVATVMSLRAALVFGTLCVAALSTKRAEACGVSASGVASCSLAEHEEAERPRWAVGLSGLYTSTRLRFSNSLRADETRYAAVSSLAYMPSSKLLLQVGLGATFAGRLVVADQRYDFLPGPLGALGADYRVFDKGPAFVML